MTMKMEMGSSSLDQENKIVINGYNDDDDDDDDDDEFSSHVSSVVSLDDESDDVFEEINSSSSNNSHMNRRGLSKYYQGKSESFTSLSKVKCLEDLAKPENPYNKKLKSCKSYVGLSRVFQPPTRSASSSKLFTQKVSSGASCSSLSNSCRLVTYS